MNYFVKEILFNRHQIKKLKLCTNRKTKKSKALFIYGEIKFNLGMLYSEQNQHIYEEDKQRIHSRFLDMIYELQEIIINE